MSDFNLNGIGGLNRLLGINNSKPASAPQGANNQSLLSQGGGVDSFQRTSSNPLGLPAAGVSARNAIKGLEGKSIEELTQGWNSSTVDTLKKAPDKFPPIEGFDS